jgi:hypothetical protein
MFALLQNGVTTSSIAPKVEHFCGVNEAIAQ